METIQIKPLRKDFIMPKRASVGSAAYDAFVQERYTIKYGRQIIPLGFALSMPQNLKLDDRTRAGYAAFGLKVKDSAGNTVRIDADVILGLIDSDYRNECGCILVVRDERAMTEEFYLERGQALSQLAFEYVPDTALVLCDTLDTTDRLGGFGKQNGEHITQD